MSSDNSIKKVLQELGKYNVYATDRFLSDVSKLVTNDIEKFVRDFFRAFSRKKFKSYNRFELLTLNSKQKKRVKGNKVWRYEYRNSSNLRCIFIVKNVNNIEEVILLCAFNEDGDKTKGEYSYVANIERATRIFEQIE